MPEHQSRQSRASCEKQIVKNIFFGRCRDGGTATRAGQAWDSKGGLRCGFHLLRGIRRRRTKHLRLMPPRRATLFLVAAVALGVPADELCSNDACASEADDCCAPGEEEMLCDFGYTAVKRESAPRCWAYPDGLYTCCEASSNITSDELDASGFEWDDMLLGDCKIENLVKSWLQGMGTLWALQTLASAAAVYVILRANSTSTGADTSIRLFPSLAFSRASQHDAAGAHANYGLLIESGFQGSESHEVNRLCRIVIQLVVFTTLSAALVEIAQVAVIAIALQASDCQEMFEFGFWILIGPIFEAIVSVVYSGCMFYVARKGVVTRNKNCECCSCCGPGYGPLRAFFQWAIVGAILAGIGGLWTTLSFAFGWSDDPNGIVTNFIYLGLLSLCAVFAQKLLAAIDRLPSSGGTDGTELTSRPPITGTVIAGDSGEKTLTL